MPQAIPFCPADLNNVENSKQYMIAMRDALEAIDAYHKAGVLHGNINPVNIMSVTLRAEEPARFGQRTRGFLVDLDPAHRFTVGGLGK